MGFLPCCFYFVVLGFFPGWGSPVRPFLPFGLGSPGAAPLASCSLLPLSLSLFPPFGFASPLVSLVWPSWGLGSAQWIQDSCFGFTLGSLGVGLLAQAK